MSNKTDIVRIEVNERAMDRLAAARLIEWAAGRMPSEKTKSDLREELDEVASDLAGPNPSPIERMLAKTAAIAWFTFRLHEIQYMGGATSETGLTIALSEHHQRRIDRAHRRLMTTLRTLATVRKLAVPSVQVNVAHNQQVNVNRSP